MTTIEVTSLDDSDVKSSKGWKKVYKITLAGMVNGVSITVNRYSSKIQLFQQLY